MEWIAVADQEPDPTAQRYIVIPFADDFPPIIAEYHQEPWLYVRGIKGFWRDTNWGPHHGIALVFTHWLPCPPSPPEVEAGERGYKDSLSRVPMPSRQTPDQIKDKMAQGMTYEEAVPAEHRMLAAMEEFAPWKTEWDSAGKPKE